MPSGSQNYRIIPAFSGVMPTPTRVGKGKAESLADAVALIAKLLASSKQ